jgi:hypothetical protein
MEISGQLHAQVALPPVGIQLEAGRAQLAVSTLWRSEKFLTLYEKIQNEIPTANFYAPDQIPYQTDQLFCVCPLISDFANQCTPFVMLPMSYINKNRF